MNTKPDDRSASVVEQPASLREAVDLLAGTSGTVLLRGAGTQLDWAGRPDPPDLTLDTRRLDGLLTHNPDDLTASVGAGMPLASLQAQLAPAGQFLALDPAGQRAGATVGGLLAAGDAGPRRLRYGNLREHVIGVTLVLADGVVGRSGGHVIKNVAGYDLAKLMHGSLGCLALVAEVVVRLQPLPVATRTVTGPADAPRATAAALSMMASAVEPSAIEWVGDDLGGRLLIRTEGTATGAEVRARRALELCREAGVDARLAAPNEADSAWQSYATALQGHPDETVFRVSMLPSQLPALDRLVREATAGTGSALVVSGAALGTSIVRLSAGSAREQAAAFARARAGVLALGGTVLLRSRPPEVDEFVDALGPEPPSVHLLRRVKAAFDPAGRLAPGRFRPWF